MRSFDCKGRGAWTVDSLMFSGFAAGVAISASLLTETFLRMRLPRAEWSGLVVSLGYTVGFVMDPGPNAAFHREHSYGRPPSGNSSDIA